MATIIELGFLQNLERGPLIWGMTGAVLTFGLSVLLFRSSGVIPGLFFAIIQAIYLYVASDDGMWGSHLIVSMILWLVIAIACSFAIAYARSME